MLTLTSLIANQGMRVVTYSQDMLIRDEAFAATLAVFCELVWLPYARVAEDVRAAYRDVDPGGKDDMRLTRLLAADEERAALEEWDAAHAVLYAAGALRRLPVAFHHEHRNIEADPDEMYPGFHSRSLTARCVLHHHFIRGDLPGIELFEGRRSPEVELVKDIFRLELPRIAGNAEQVCELRALAQRKDIAQFWQMIDEQAAYMEAGNEAPLARAEKIRGDFERWTTETMKLRGSTLATVGGAAAAITLAVVTTPFVIPISALLAAGWIGDVNAWWARRKSTQQGAFKFMSRIMAGPAR